MHRASRDDEPDAPPPNGAHGGPALVAATGIDAKAAARRSIAVAALRRRVADRMRTSWANSAGES